MTERCKKVARFTELERQVERGKGILWRGKRGFDVKPFRGCCALDIVHTVRPSAMSLQHFGKGALRVAKNYTKGYSDTQAKVRDATSNDPWGPSGTQMNEIAQMTYNQCVSFIYLCAQNLTWTVLVPKERLCRDHGNAGQEAERQGQELAPRLQSACVSHSTLRNYVID